MWMNECIIWICNSQDWMKGFMCQSVEVASGCTIPDARNVIVPRRVLGKNDGLSTRLVDMEKSRFGDRKEDNAARRGQSLVANGSLEIVQRTSPTPEVNPSDDVLQVVVMRVSLHCQGCAGKVKKHLSKMEGVTSFSIDLEEKRVTVRGHVSPAGVLESISKVKRAELWTSL